MKRSEILLAGWVATEKALPEEALALIKHHDALYDVWRKAGFSTPIPPELTAASDAIDAHPLASIPFKLRQQCNQAAADEYRQEKNLEKRGQEVVA